MAAGVLAGVGPVQGLYAGIAGRIFGGLSTGTPLMVVTTTSASALAAGSALADVPVEDRQTALFLLTLLAGVMMVLAGLLRLGRFTRFVSHSVMTGFLMGISANIVCGQLSTLLGVPVDGGMAIHKALQVFTYPGEIDTASAVVGVLALAILFVLLRTRIRLFATLAAVSAPSLLVMLAGWDSVERVSDEGIIPDELPLPALPDFTVLTPSVLTGAAAVMVIVLVQGAGVADVVPQDNSRTATADRDFTGQGVGNIGAALLQGMPVGASVGQTALNQAAGARTRWAGVWSGIWLLLIVVAFSAAVGQVSMPTLSAVLIIAALGSFGTARVQAIWSSGFTSRLALTVTFVCTLLLPVTVAVGIGVALSLMLQLNQEAMDLRVVRLRVVNDQLVEDQAPDSLADNSIVILDVYGSLFYAGARTLETRLPDPGRARAPVVILRLRGRTTVSATFFAVIAAYAGTLDRAGGRLYLSGVDTRVRAAWNDDLLAKHGIRLEFFPATPVVGESTLAAFAQARVWVHDQEG
ncbi:SulP family inorganic anion transporter [Gordonia terrae]|uniref:SulP family inorganic anion transporter n=1 Tax=Gordonia terrae TaxID=2055 RepID=UPI00200A8E06|nr:solute carrier family 23 protein [Gordonia terrae]UPW07269.1 SulP family inorganic anion transporter [Gordonia terrae]